jgi:YfiH family protein
MTAEWIAADWPAPPNIIAGTTLRAGRLESLSLPGEPCWLQQVHGARVVAADRYETPPEADASISARPGDVCVVRSADCLPVLFCSTDGLEVAAAHAGWRGLAAGVLEATVAKLTHDAVDLIAWLGPAISQPAFEVGAEVKDAFVNQDPDASRCFEPNARGRWQADLYELARRRLGFSGINAIYGGGFCTFADTRRFFSYRRDPNCGRLISFVARRS